MREIKLTKGKVALVDDDDFRWLNQWKWQYCTKYASRVTYEKTKKGVVRRRIFMHCLIVNKPPNREVDHINRDSLDNRKSNLRICTRIQNNANRVPYGKTGVKGAFLKPNGRYQVMIGYKGKQRHISMADTLDEAKQFYNNEALRLYGEFGVYD